MKKAILFAAILLAAVACTKEQAGGNTSLTIQAGFEQEPQASTKTYVKDSNAGTVWWGTSGLDKVLFVFDSSDNKKVFTSEATTSEAVRTFTCNDWSGGAVKYAIWTGVSASKDNCSLSGSVISGSSLTVRNPQTVNNSKSFDNSANIAVMKPSDGVLRNVFGYIRFTLPAYEGTTNISAIKSITLTADEDISGEISIDYSGDFPVATIVANGSRSLTLNARWKNTGYEAGMVYMVLPTGTYHNPRLTVTPFSEEPTAKEAATGAPFTLSLGSEFTILRGKYTDCKTLPSTAPSNPGSPAEWPADADAFDANLADGETRKAKISTNLMSAQGVSAGVKLTAPAVVDDITYGPGITYNGNRFTVEKVASDWTAEYSGIIPASNYFSFKINRPGTLKFYPAVYSLTNGDPRVPTYYLAVVTTVNGVTSAKIVNEFVPSEIANGTVSDNRSDTNVYSADWQKYWVSLSVTEADLAGIESAATVYLFHRNPSVNTLTVLYWPLEWTSEKPSGCERIPKLLLAGDSTCTEYPASSAPQTGWGQCLAGELGEKAIVNNYAVGGESTKSFIDSGKWGNLVNDIYSDDIVLIQFGHNDQKTAETHHTDPETTYKENLTRMINDVRDKGGVPVLITSVSRRQFTGGVLQRTHGDYPKAMRELAASTSTPLIDVEEQTFQWLSQLGEEGSVPYYVMDKRDPSAMDNTHITKEGAQVVAAMVAQGLKDKGIWNY